jgi:peptide deformylase
MATKEDIITLPHDSLHKRSKRVGLVTDEIVGLVEDMKTATLDWEDSRPHEFGIALAAPQIDKLLRIVIIRNSFDDKDDREFTAFINPEIVKKEGEIVEDYEGCLSVKDIYGLVPRYSKVKVKALDLSGKEIRLTAEGFLARVFQHEVDHTHGVVFVDHIENNKDAFFHLADNGKLEKINYEQVKKLGILRN